MSLEAWGDEGDHAPEGYITEEESNELIEEARAEGIAEGLERAAKVCRTEAERLRKIHQANPSVIVECGICTASGLEAGIRSLASAKQPDAEGGQFDFVAHIERAKAFSERTFGPGHRSKGVVDHIRKELLEIEAAPLDLEEWIDVWMLALDGAWRTGATAQQIVAQILAKQEKNEGRKWPDWRTADRDKGIEHDRSAEALAAVPDGHGNR